MEEKLKRLEEVFSCLPPVLIKRILCREDVNGDIDKASVKLQEFQDMDNPLDIFKSPPASKPPVGKPKGKLDDSSVNSSGNQPGDRAGEEKRSKGTEQKNARGRRQRGSFGNENEMHRDQGDFQDEHDSRRRSFDNNRMEQRGGYQAHQGQSSRGARGRSRGGPRGGPRGGSAQGQGHHQGFRDNDMRMPVPLMSQEWGFGDDNTFQPLGGHGNRGGRGQQPKTKPKPKNRNRGYRGRARGGYSQRQDEYQTTGGFQEGYQFSYDQSQFTQRQNYPERGRGQQNQGRREPRGRDAPPVFLRDLASANTEARRACDDSDLGLFRDVDSNRLDQANRGRPRGSGNRGRGQRGMRHAQSLSNLIGCDQSSGIEENTEERSRFEQRKLRIRGLSESTTDDALTNFIEAMSGEEVKEVLRLRNGNAIVTMANDITSKSICRVILCYH